MMLPGLHCKGCSTRDAWQWLMLSPSIPTRNTYSSCRMLAANNIIQRECSCQLTAEPGESATTRHGAMAVLCSTSAPSCMHRTLPDPTTA
jgi:hypothetical protein